MKKITGRKLAWIIVILAITITAMSFIAGNAYAVEEKDGIACRVKTGSVVAYIIHNGQRVDFNKTIQELKVTALSFMPKNVSDRISQITKENWNGAVMVALQGRDGKSSYFYFQRPNIMCP